jgi:hypothetical protein
MVLVSTSVAEAVDVVISNDIKYSPKIVGVKDVDVDTSLLARLPPEPIVDVESSGYLNFQT